MKTDTNFILENTNIDELKKTMKIEKIKIYQKFHLQIIQLPSNIFLDKLLHPKLTYFGFLTILIIRQLLDQHELQKKFHFIRHQKFYIQNAIQKKVMFIHLQ